jgi:excisionase family DNA binding protein
MSPAPNAPEFLTVADVAKLLRVGPKIVRRLVRLNQIPHKVVDGRKTLRFRRQSVIDWFDGYTDERGRRVAR